MSDSREQEDSIKDRKKLLFDKDESPTAFKGVERKPFALYLRQTPPQPLSAGLKALLWTTGIVVGLLLLGAVWKSSQLKEKEKGKTGMTQTLTGRIA